MTSEKATIMKKAMINGLPNEVKSFVVLIAKKLSAPKRAAVIKNALATRDAPLAKLKMCESSGVMITPLKKVKAKRASYNFV